MVFIFNIPTNFLNSTLQFNYPKDQVISVFTTYNREDYFLDSIVYNGDIEELQNIKNGYTKSNFTFCLLLQEMMRIF